MAASATNYSDFFKEEQQAKGAVIFSDGRNLPFDGQITQLKKDLLTLELLGPTASDERLVEAGNEVSLTIFTGWSICRCKASVAGAIQHRELLLRLNGPVNEKQNREHFRMDVVLPISFSIPDKQTWSIVSKEWVTAREAIPLLPPPVMKPGLAGATLVSWRDVTEIEATKVNLSPDGMGFKSSQYINPGSYISVHLFLPLQNPQTVLLVAEVLRCTEIQTSRLRGGNHNAAARFRLIHEKDRAMIVAYIFEEQRKLMRARAGIGS
jgi:Family of unknown function (DUF5634) N-terminal domain/PilZ domain